MKMKTKNNLSALRMRLLVVSLTATAYALATTPAEVNLRTFEGSKKAEMYISAKSEASISVEDQNGETLFYSNNVKKGANYKKVIDFSQSSEGVYDLKVESNTGLILYKVLVSTSGIELLNETSMLLRNASINNNSNVYPVFRYNQNNLFISFINNFNEKINLSIKNDEQTLFEDEIEGEYILQKKYNTKNLSTGLYTVALTTKNNVYDYKFLVP